MSDPYHPDSGPGVPLAEPPPKPRYTALWHVTTYDGAERQLDQRCFKGTDDEVLEELKAEYDEHFPCGWVSMFGPDPNKRDDEFWIQKRRAISAWSKARVYGQNKQMGIFRIYEVERFTPHKKEEEHEQAVQG